MVHDKCFPFDAIKETAKCMKNVVAITYPMYSTFISCWVKSISIKPSPNQATVVRCQAKRKVFFVKFVPPNNFGKLLRLNKRIRIYFSPRYEWANPIIAISKNAICKAIESTRFQIKF